MPSKKPPPELGPAALGGLFEAQAAPVVVLDADWHLVFANRAALVLLGYEPGELAGVHVDELVPEQLRDANRRLREVPLDARSHQPLIDQGERVLRTTEGREVPIQLSLTRVRVEGGDYRVASLVGLSQQKDAEQETIEVAHKGTLFLDELGELELAVQPKLLTALEEGSFRRVGETTPRAADVRLIAATHRNLAGMVKDGRFRDDLLFRINTLTLEIPALRQRSQDIQALSQAVLKELCRRGGRPAPELTDDVLGLLTRCPWPGNMRGLHNVLERALLFCKGDVLDRAALRFDRSLEPDGAADAKTLDDAERRHIVTVLKENGGKVDEAAKVLALSRSSLYAKLKKIRDTPGRRVSA